MTINEIFSGYCDDHSMSVRARDAYEDGEMPISKWTKSAIISSCAEILEGSEDAVEKLAALKRHTLDTLKTLLLVQSSWHHTSKMYNCTDFYRIDDGLLDDLSPAEISAWKPVKTAVAQTSPRRKGSICYLVWGGTRNHPRAWEEKEENVWIEERGQFYHVFRRWNSKDLILRKKKDSRGTVVTYTK